MHGERVDAKHFHGRRGRTGHRLVQNDLDGIAHAEPERHRGNTVDHGLMRCGAKAAQYRMWTYVDHRPQPLAPKSPTAEDGRVGQEGDRTLRPRWAREQ